MKAVICGAVLTMAISL
ncbi:hypothetical protein D043_1366A, partial [Vibrio parahaemolyticus EKP-021]